MEDVIGRIVEIERQCAEGVEKAERESLLRVDTFRRELEEQKAEDTARIVAACNARLEKALDDARHHREEESLAEELENERILQDAELKDSIREMIVSIILDQRVS